MQRWGQIRHSAFGILVASAIAATAFAQADDPRELELLARGAKSHPDLLLPKDAKELSFFSDVRNGLFKPADAGNGPFPALVLAHTCGGIRVPESKYWLQAALKEGYIVLVIDSLRGNQSNCIAPPPVPFGRLVKDLYDAAEHLSKLPFVDPARMAVVGFSQGAFSAGALASPSVKATLAPGAPRFAASVGMYGTCQWPAGTFKGVDYPFRFVFSDTDRPLLYLMAANDVETPSSHCDTILPALRDKGAPVEWHKYPDVTHCWDCSTLNGFTKVDFKGVQVVYRYDKDATEESRKRLFDFLGKQLKP